VPRVLFYDLETAPNMAAVWRHYEANVVWYDHEWYLMAVAYKWEGDRAVKCLALPDYKGYTKRPEDDKALSRDLWNLMHEADIVVAHNGDKFDMRKANARFLAHDFGPPAPSHSIDTLKVARKHFAFNSNRLGDLGEHMGLGGKEPTGGYHLWRDCMRGDEKAWQRMKKYAKQDVNLLEQVYLKMRPWMKNHPSRNLLSGLMDACPVCGVEGSFIKRGTWQSKTMTYQRVQCTDCGSYSRSRLSDSSADKPKFIT